MITRRSFIAQAAGIAALGLAGSRLPAHARALAQSTRPITVYKSRTCGCCVEWVDHLRENGFAPTSKDDEGMDLLKDQLGVPAGVRSCHTAVVDKYLIEGHVPAADIHRLLRERPKIAGLAVPGMPAQSPGMAQPGEPISGFDVVAFQIDGTTEIFSRY
jgi:hypothetical protein